MGRPRSLLHGFGVNDADYTVRYNIGEQCPFYQAWSNMIKRCYGKSSPLSYKDCIVCDEWKSFMTFRSWMITKDWSGNHLDKDLLSNQNKIYSPTTCAFIPSHVNRFMTEEKPRKSNYLKGAYPARGGKFRANVSHNGSNIYVGLFDTEKEAHNAYCIRKFEIAKSIANDLTDKSIADALIKRYHHC